MRARFPQLFGVAMAAALLVAGGDACAANAPDRTTIRRIVDEAIRPLMAEHHVPGMAVAVTIGGERHVLNYGVASIKAGRAVDDGTIFEIGSISKTFTATLAAYAQAKGALSFSDMASARLPALAGSAFDRISLLELATYTAGGLPLQFPDSVTDTKSMIAFYRTWRPTNAPGAYRLYSNPSIGLFGHITAASLGAPFEDLMEDKLFPMLGLDRTTVRRPEAHMDDYAFGYSQGDTPTRMTPGALDSEAYGVRTTATDMLRFVEANMDGAGLDETLRRAIAATHIGHFKIGDMVQGLGWEIYDDPADLGRLLAGNSPEMIVEANKAERLDPPLSPQPNVLLNKTGSTKGFGAYVAFAPTQRVGIVMLANRNYPIPARIRAAHRILMGLAAEPGATTGR